MRAKTTKLLEENIHANGHGLGSSSGFSDRTPKVQVTKEKTAKLEFTEMFCVSENIFKKMRR